MSAKIRDLKPHMENVTVVARVLNKTKEIEIRGKKYASATIEDSTGKIMLNLWRDQVSQVEEGDLVRVQEGFVHVRMGVKQLSTWSDIKKASLNEFLCYSS
jgi:ssDNA-binding replication factor A large subunit